jgi:hypothetical protein
MIRRIPNARLRRPVRLVLLKLHPKWLQFFLSYVIFGNLPLVPNLQWPRLARRRSAEYRRFLICTLIEFYLHRLASLVSLQDAILRYSRLKIPATFSFGPQQEHPRNQGYPPASSSFGCGSARLGASVFGEKPNSPPTDVVT